MTAIIANIGVMVLMFFMIRSIVENIKWSIDNPDPVKVCKVYKTVGCAHVDGPLCNPKTCNIEVHVIVSPKRVKESAK